jgi:hypothetical protein
VQDLFTKPLPLSRLIRPAPTGDQGMRLVGLSASGFYGQLNAVRIAPPTSVDWFDVDFLGGDTSSYPSVNNDNASTKYTTTCAGNSLDRFSTRPVSAIAG